MAQDTGWYVHSIGGNGRTVYEFANDKDGASTGTGACAANWPFAPAPASVPASLLGVAGRLGTTTRSDGPTPG